MKPSEKLIALFIAGVILSGCSSNSKHNEKPVSTSSTGSATESIEKINNYEGTGIVLSITPNKKQVIIKHGVIPGFMEAMTMPFNVVDSSILKGIHPKDSVRLFIDYDGTKVVLRELKKIQ